MKKFDDVWSEQDINAYLEMLPVVVLFKIHQGIKEAELIIRGNIDKNQELILKVCILSKFGGKNVSKNIYEDINKFAVQWYNNNVATKKVRVINFKKK